MTCTHEVAGQQAGPSQTARDALEDQKLSETLQNRRAADEVLPQIPTTTHTTPLLPTPDSTEARAENPRATGTVRNETGTLPVELVAELDAIVNLEHLQLKPEDAFFLAYGLGSLQVEHPVKFSADEEREADENENGKLSLVRTLSSTLS